MAPPAGDADRATANELQTFSERPAFNLGMSAAAQSAGVGLLVSAVQNSMQKHDKGALGVFTRTGSTIALFTAIGGIFAYTDSTIANIRQKDDFINGAAGGCAAGLVAGASARSIPMMVGSCAAMAALVGTFDAAGKSITGSYSHATPIFGAPAAQHGSAVEGEGAEHAGVGERGWREERERRRQSFFKQKKSSDDVETE